MNIIKSLSGTVLMLRYRHDLDKTNTMIWHEISLAESVDGTKLRDAVRIASDFCPYVKMSPRFGNDNYLYLAEDDNHVPVINTKYNSVEEVSVDGAFCSILYDENRVLFLISHAITDGLGCKWFIETCLDIYHATGKTFNYVAHQNEKGYYSDVLIQEAKDRRETKSPIYPKGDFLRINKSDDDNKKEPTSIIINRCLLENLVGIKNISYQVLLTAAVSIAIQNSEPCNDKDICVRIPVNARKYYGIGNSFQNAALPKIYLHADIKNLKEKRIDIIVKEMVNQMEKQLEKDNIDAIMRVYHNLLNQSSELKQGRQVLPPTNIMVSYLGILRTSEETITHITGIKEGFIEAGNANALMIYAYTLDDKVHITLFDSWSGGKFKKELDKIFNG